MRAVARLVFVAVIGLVAAGCCISEAGYTELVADFGQDLEGVGGALGHEDRAMALTEARRAASEARTLAAQVEWTRPEAARHFRAAAGALDQVSIDISRNANHVDAYQRAFVEADAARNAIGPADLCRGTLPR